jgi:hypothetical protein
MAITYTVKPGLPFLVGTIGFKDNGYSNFQTNIPVLATTVIADMEAITDLADPLSGANICNVDLTGDQGVTCTGATIIAQGAAGADFARVTEIIQFEFQSPTECRAVEFVQVPAPITGIYSDVANRTVNLSNAAVLAFTNAVKARIATRNPLIAVQPADWTVVNAERTTVAEGYRGKRNS